MKKIVVMNGEKVLEFNADVFIVPNTPTKLSEVADFQKVGYHELANSIIDATNPQLGLMQPDDQFLQVWITSKDDLGTENLTDHGADVTDTNGKDIHFWPCGDKSLSELPAKLFIGKKEGDVVDVIVPNYQLQHFIPKNSDEQPVFAKIIMHLRLNQQNYRYRRFGTFDSLFKQLTGLREPVARYASNSCEAAAMEG